MSGRISDHITRAVRPDDAEAFRCLNLVKRTATFLRGSSDIGTTFSKTSTKGSSGTALAELSRLTSRRMGTGISILKSTVHSRFAKPPGYRPSQTGIDLRVLPACVSDRSGTLFHLYSLPQSVAGLKTAMENQDPYKALKEVHLDFRQLLLNGMRTSRSIFRGGAVPNHGTCSWRALSSARARSPASVESTGAYPARPNARDLTDLRSDGG